MANSVKLVQNIAGGISKSNLVKVGLGESINCYPEIQDINEHSCQILNRTVEGQVQAALIPGKCRGMYRVSRGYDNRPVLYAVYDDTLYLIHEDNSWNTIGTIPSIGTECHMVETGRIWFCSPTLDNS